MHHFKDLLNQPLAVVFIDEVAGKERWQVQTGIVVPGTDGQAIRFPPSAQPAFQLAPEWQERLKPVPDAMREDFAAEFAIYVRVKPLPANADLDDYSFTGINLNE